MLRPQPLDKLARRRPHGPIAPVTLSLLALACSAETAAADEAVLPAVSVVSSGSGGYNPPDATGATRTDAPLREIPQSVRVLPRALLDDIGATRFDETFDYASGVTRQSNFGGLWDNFAIRGFTGNENTGANYLVNGFVANRGFTAARDAATIERVEVLKGPTASLYGSGDPGGTINIVTRQARFRPAQAYDFEIGTDDRYRAAADVTGPLGKSVAGRLIAVADHAGTTRDFVNSQRYLLAPSLSWTVGPDTLIQYQGEIQRFSVPMDRGVVSVDGQLGRIPRSRFLGEPGDGDIRLDSQSHQVTLEHRWSEQWSGRMALAYRGSELTGFSSEAASLAADDRTLWRQRRYRDFRSDDVSLQADVTGRFQTGWLQHEFLLGVDNYRFSNSQFQLRHTPSATQPYAIDIYTPVYGQASPAMLRNVDTHERQTNVGFYAQDRMSLSQRWKLLAGVRFDSFDQTLDNRLRGTSTDQKHTAISPRVGITYLASNNWSLFANASQSFRPNSGADAEGNAFDPEEGRAVEAGTKWDSDDRRLGATLAAFEIHKRNVLTADPDNTAFQIAAGKARSRGIELDFAGRLGKYWRISAAFALTDAEITEDNRLAAGTPLLNIPRTAGSVLAMYENASATGKRFGVGAGVRYVGKRSGDTQDSFALPSYTVADLHGYWQVAKPVRLTMQVGNLFDKRYYATSLSPVWIAPGMGRTLRLGMQLRY